VLASWQCFCAMEEYGMPLMSRGSEDGFVWLHAFVARYGLVMRLEALVTHSFESMLFLLERIQHRFTRMIPGFKTLSYEEKLRKLDLWTQRLWSHPTCWRYINKSIIIIIIIEERRNRADLLQVFKMYKGLSTIPFSNFFTLTLVLLLILEDTLPRLRKTDVGWI